MGCTVAFHGYLVHTEKALAFHADDHMVLDHWSCYHQEHTSLVQQAVPLLVAFPDYPYGAFHLDSLHHSLSFGMA
jgi:hypothetical protein